MSYNVADNAGNSTFGSIPAVQVDTTGPVNEIVGVNPGDRFLLGNVPTISCRTTDGLSGVAIRATLSGGSPSAVGEYTASCSGGTDYAGNAANTTSVTYTVGYDFLGSFNPINDPSTLSTHSGFRRGSTIPVKFALADNAGVRISDAEAQALVNTCGVRLFWVKGSSTGTGPSETVNTSPANSENCFRYDAGADQFVYNLGTKQFTSGAWRLIARVASGGGEHTVHPATVTVQ